MHYKLLRRVQSDKAVKFVGVPCGRYSAGGVAHVLFSVGVGGSTVLQDLLRRMNDGGMPTRDISGIEAAQVRVTQSSSTKLVVPNRSNLARLSRGMMLSDTAPTTNRRYSPSCLPQVHLRHLVGGRARSYMGNMPHEVMLQVRRDS